MSFDIADHLAVDGLEHRAHPRHAGVAGGVEGAVLVGDLVGFGDGPAQVLCQVGARLFAGRLVAGAVAEIHAGQGGADHGQQGVRDG